MTVMPEQKCPFSIVLPAASCHCRHAHEVVRRGGSEFDCRVPAAREICTALTRHLNAIALPALGYDDDLTRTPRSVYERILLGGLLGLRISTNDQHTDPQTADIISVANAALQQYGTISDIPGGDVIPAIESCSIRKRQRKRHDA